MFVAFVLIAYLSVSMFCFEVVLLSEGLFIVPVSFENSCRQQ